jgi:hypothetical protein
VSIPVVAVLSAVEQKLHGSRPAIRNNGKGTGAVSYARAREKMTAYSNISDRG